MLQNASFLAIVAVDTDENEPLKNLRWFVHYFNNLLGTFPLGPSRSIPPYQEQKIQREELRAGVAQKDGRVLGREDEAYMPSRATVREL